MKKKIFKIMVIGEGGVGKSSITKSAIANKYDPGVMTIGTDIHLLQMNLEELSCSLQIWDLGGQDQFKDMAVFGRYSKGARGAIFCYDLSDPMSLHTIDSWIGYLYEENTYHIPIILVGTKADASFIPFEEITAPENIMKKYQIRSYFATSSKEMLNVRDPFLTLCKQMIQAEETREASTPLITAIESVQ